MIKPKLEIFSDENTRMADIAKALSHPARIQILCILGELKTCICGDIVKLVPLSQSTVSQHLKELKRVGLIKGEIEGPKTCYCINPDVVAETEGLFKDLFGKISFDDACNSKNSE